MQFKLLPVLALAASVVAADDTATTALSKYIMKRMIRFTAFPIWSVILVIYVALACFSSLLKIRGLGVVQEYVVLVFVFICFLASYLLRRCLEEGFNYISNKNSCMVWIGVYIMMPYVMCFQLAVVGNLSFSRIQTGLWVLNFFLFFFFPL